VGNCNGDERVSVGELVAGVEIALGRGALADCAAFDRDRSGRLTIDELSQGVRNSLLGCGVAAAAGTRPLD
jgi:hypothetical protein